MSAPIAAPPPPPFPLSALLGDPADPVNPFGWPQALRREASGEAPEEALARLTETGFALEWSPAHWGMGGKLTDFGRLFSLARDLATRDAALIPPFAAGLGAAMAVEIAGSSRQKTILSGLARGGGLVAQALTEPHAPGELEAIRAKAWSDREGWRLSGRKALTPGAGAARALTVLARDLGHKATVAEAGETEGQISMFLLPREGQGARLKTGPRRRLVGLAGLDLAETRFEAAEAPERIGALGAGADLARRSLNATRVLTLAGLFGPLETSLGLAASLQAAENPARAPEKAMIAEALAAFWALESFAEAVLRAFGAAPDHAGLWAEALQARAMEAGAPLFAAAAAALGERGALADDPAGALFGKLRRDAESMRALDPEGPRVLGRLATHVAPLTTAAGAVAPEARWLRLRAAFEGAAPEAPRWAEIALRPATGEALTESFPALAAAAEKDSRLGPEARAPLVGALRKSHADLLTLNQAHASLLRAGGHSYALSPEFHDAGAAFARHAALAAAAAWWLARPTDPRPFYQSGEALALAAAQLAGSPAPRRGRLREGVWEIWRASGASARAAA